MKLPIIIHMAGATVAFIAPLFIFWRRKGDKWHRAVGGLFALGIYTSATAAFFITPYTPIHILAALNLYWVTAGLYAVATRHKHYRHEHLTNMGGAYISTIIAGGGVMTRHFIVPGNYNAGYLVSLVIAIPSIYLLRRFAARFALRHS